MKEHRAEAQQNPQTFSMRHTTHEFRGSMRPPLPQAHLREALNLMLLPDCEPPLAGPCGSALARAARCELSQWLYESGNRLSKLGARECCASPRRVVRLESTRPLSA